VDDVIKDVLIWLHDQNATDSRMLWVYDDNRSLTSFIGQAVARILAKRGELVAAYFFPAATLGNSGGDGSHVVPTLAYQLTMNVPAAAISIADTIAHDLAIFDLDIYEQVAKLLVEPLKLASRESVNPSTVHSAIVIHGLDACNDANFQSIFLDSFVHAWESTDAIPFSQRLIVMGPPTAQLRESLGKPNDRLLLSRPIRIQHPIEISRRDQELRRGNENPMTELEQQGKQLDGREETPTEVIQGLHRKIGNVEYQRRTDVEEMREVEMNTGEREVEFVKSMVQMPQQPEVAHSDRENLHMQVQILKADNNDQSPTVTPSQPNEATQGPSTTTANATVTTTSEGARCSSPKHTPNVPNGTPGVQKNVGFHSTSPVPATVEQFPPLDIANLTAPTEPAGPSKTTDGKQPQGSVTTATSSSTTDDAIPPTESAVKSRAYRAVSRDASNTGSFNAVACRYNEISKHDIVIVCVLKATISAQLMPLFSRIMGPTGSGKSNVSHKYLQLWTVNSHLDLSTVHRCCDKTIHG